MINYLKTNDVDVFPIASARLGTKTSAHYLMETRLTKWLSTMSNKSGFIVSDKFENNTIEFVIDGYYFCINIDVDEDLLGYDRCYAFLVKQGATSQDYIFSDSISDGETSNTFKGLYISNSDTPPNITLDPNTSAFVSPPLLLLQKDSNGWFIPESSKRGYIDIDVDGGEV